MSNGDCPQSSVEIEDLPDEVLEFVLSLISPYQDLHDCMLVSKRWRRCVLNVAKVKQRNLHRAIAEFNVKWSSYDPTDVASVITSRHSHTAVIHENAMYVFGGCTCYMTTFNDLWRFDLSRREWERPKAEGTYPSPKACSTFMPYKDILVLFGGWTYPPSYPPHQSFHLFDELHVYDIPRRAWKCINASNSPPPMAGHSASIVGEWMIVFGGMRKPQSVVHSEMSNDIWKLNLETWVWYRQEVVGDVKPKGRLGQTQVVLDDYNIMIIGGSGGRGIVCVDVWVLNMSGKLWKWTQIKTEDNTNRPIHIFANSGCKVGDKVVILNKIRETQPPPIVYYPKSSWARHDPEDDNSKSARIDLANRKPDRDENVNGKRGTLRNHRKEVDNKAGPSQNHRPDVVINDAPNHGLTLSAYISDHEKTRKERRLAHLARSEDRMKTFREDKTSKNHLGLYVLDVSRALDAVPNVTWLPPKNLNYGPEETTMYTLLAGKSELIMFGGVRKDPNVPGFSFGVNDLRHKISNSLYFITAPSYVI